MKSSLKNANKAFRDKKYAKAIEAYLEIYNGSDVNRKICIQNLYIMTRQLKNNISNEFNLPSVHVLDFDISCFDLTKINLIAFKYDVSDKRADLLEGSLPNLSLYSGNRIGDILDYVVKNPLCSIAIDNVNIYSLLLGLFYRIIWSSTLSVNGGNKAISYYIEKLLIFLDVTDSKFLEKISINNDLSDQLLFSSYVDNVLSLEFLCDYLSIFIKLIFIFEDGRVKVDGKFPAACLSDITSDVLYSDFLEKECKTNSELKAVGVYDLISKPVGVKSRIEICDERGVSGWYVPSNFFDTNKHYLALEIDGNTIDFNSFDVLREDVFRVMKLNSVGFNFNIPFSLFDGKKHELILWGIVGQKKFQVTSKVFELLSPWFEKDENTILLCSHNLKIQGAQTSLYQLAIGLKNRLKTSVVVYSPSDGPLRKKYLENGIKVIVQKEPNFRGLSIDEWRKEFVSFMKCIEILNPRCIIANTLLSFQSELVALTLNIPNILIPRESESPESFYDFLFEDLRIYANSIVSNASATVFVSSTTMDLWESKNKKNNFHLIHNGLLISDLEKKLIGKNRSSIRSQFGFDDSIIILCIGTVCERKGQLDLIKAIPKINDVAKNSYKVIIVGINSDEYSLKCKEEVNRFSDELKNKVIMLPHTDSEDDTLIPELYLASDLFVMCSRYESYPRVILEALFFGLPVVSTPCFGVVEQVEEFESGMFYEENNPIDLSNKLVGFIDNREKLARFRKNASDRFKTLTSYEGMLDKYVGIVNGVIGDGY
jgi:glycosyltransferase involved in cell wall biosynthesis